MQAQARQGEIWINTIGIYCAQGTHSSENETHTADPKTASVLPHLCCQVLGDEWVELASFLHVADTQTWDGDV